MTFPAYADDWTTRPGWPAADEVPGLIKDLVGEVRAELDSDRWAILVGGPTGMARVHSGSALWHCCQLLQRLEGAHARGDEMIGRLIARSLLETWFTGLYVHLGGIDALNAVAAAYKDGLVKQHRRIADHDDRIRKARDDVAAFNEKVAHDNAGIERWNAIHPNEPSKPLRELKQVPEADTIDFDSTPALAQFPHLDPKPLPLATMVDQIAGFTKGTDDEASFTVAYDLAYRGLSGLGAHPTLWVLNAYLDSNSGRSNFVRVIDDPDVGSFAQPNLDSGLYLTTTLASKVLGAAGADLPVCDAISNRFVLPDASDGE